MEAGVVLIYPLWTLGQGQSNIFKVSWLHLVGFPKPRLLLHLPTSVQGTATDLFFNDDLFETSTWIAIDIEEN